MKKMYLLAIGTMTLILTLIWMNPGTAQTYTRVGLVIHQENGTLVTQCLEFDTEQVNGLDVLNRSGNAVVTMIVSGQGQAVCKIGNTGCPADDCFCEFPNYWSYWHSDPAGWTYSSSSLDRYIVQDGMVEAWAWGAGEAPTQVSFDKVCPAVNGTGTLPGKEFQGQPPGNQGEPDRSQAAQRSDPVSVTSPDQSSLMPLRNAGFSTRSLVGYVVFILLAMAFALVLSIRTYLRRR